MWTIDTNPIKIPTIKLVDMLMGDLNLEEYFIIQGSFRGNLEIRNLIKELLKSRKRYWYFGKCRSPKCETYVVRRSNTWHSNEYTQRPVCNKCSFRNREDKRAQKSEIDEFLLEMSEAKALLLRNVLSAKEYRQEVAHIRKKHKKMLSTERLDK